MGYKQQLEQKKKRDANLYAYHLANPLMSFRDLARIFKVTGARVGQIIKAMRENDVKNNDTKEA